MTVRAVEGLCAVCARMECGIGFHLHLKVRRSPILWVCDDPECLEIAKETKNMRQDEFTRLEKQAALKGGDEAGVYLEQIGKTDMARLSQAEWGEFCRRLVAGYRASLREELKIRSANGK